MIWSHQKTRGSVGKVRHATSDMERYKWYGERWVWAKVCSVKVSEVLEKLEYIVGLSAENSDIWSHSWWSRAERNGCLTKPCSSFTMKCEWGWLPSRFLLKMIKGGRKMDWPVLIKRRLGECIRIEKSKGWNGRRHGTSGTQTRERRRKKHWGKVVTG